MLLHVFNYLKVVILQFVGGIMSLLLIWHGGWMLGVLITISYGKLSHGDFCGACLKG